MSLPCPTQVQVRCRSSECKAPCPIHLIDPGRTLQVHGPLLSAGFQPPGRIRGQAAHLWPRDVLETTAALFSQVPSLPLPLPYGKTVMARRTRCQAPSCASPGDLGVRCDGSHLSTISSSPWGALQVVSQALPMPRAHRLRLCPGSRRGGCAGHD